MNQAVTAALSSWRFDPPLIATLLLTTLLYIRGWLRLHREMPTRFGPWHLASFLLGESALFLAIASPLDSFASFLLSVHMVQHLLLIAVAPPLLWLGQPFLPLLRGLPRPVVKEALSPFLSAPELRRFANALTHPLVCWLAGTAATVFWHLPTFYELGLQSPTWHRVEHASFLFGSLLFWWPVIQVWPSKRHTSRWLMIPYLISADVVNSILSAYLVFSAQVVYPSYALAPRLWNISALNDQSMAGALMWVPGSVVYLLAAAIITYQALSGKPGIRPSTLIKPVPQFRPSRTATVMERTTVLSTRRAAQITMLLLATLIMLDGFRGPQISPLNLAGVLPWTHWRAIAIIALLTAGNLVCFSCPFTLPRDIIRRFVPQRLRWPPSLRNKWIPAALTIVFLWSYEAFSLWDSPWWTAWIIASYFITATLIDTLFQGASFCKYVCPIGQFQFVNSLISPLEVTVKSPKVCDTCQTHDCLHACKLDLFQPKKSGSFDCTFCMECVTACPTSNVTIAAVVPARPTVFARLTNRTDVAALALLIVLGAFLSATAMTNPVRDWTSDSPLRISLIFGLLLVPALILFTTPHKYVLALVPLGASMWTAHFGYHLLTAGSSLVPAAARFLGVALTQTSGMGTVPDWWPPLEILLLDAGLLLTLYLEWRSAARKFRPFAPWAFLAVLLYAAGLWILAQPMQMRGMVMN